MYLSVTRYTKCPINLFVSKVYSLNLFSPLTITEAIVYDASSVAIVLSRGMPGSNPTMEPVDDTAQVHTWACKHLELRSAGTRLTQRYKIQNSRQLTNQHSPISQ